MTLTENLKNPLALLKQVHTRLHSCRKCSTVCDRAVFGHAIETKVMIVGQAPGVHEASRGRPFAHTAGKTLFKWLSQATGAEEDDLREMIYFTAVARCFPGKAANGKGDRAPSREEIENCREFLRSEVQALKPTLILAVGKLAISEVLLGHAEASSPLEDVVGKKFNVRFHGQELTVIPLPHPSGVSRWPHTEPGKTRLAKALRLLKRELGPIL